MAGIDGGIGGVRVGGAQLDQQQGIGDLGGQQVREGGGGVKRTLSEWAGKVKAFFQDVGTKFSEWKQGIADRREAAALKRATDRVDTALTKVIKDVNSGQVNGKTLNKLNAALNDARRIDGQNPHEVLKDRMVAVLRDTDTATLTNMAKMDFDGLKAGLKQIVDQRVDRAVTLVKNLERNGMGGGDVNELRQGGLQQKQGIERLVDAFSEGVGQARFDRFRDAVGGVFTVGQDGRINTVRGDLMIPGNDGPLSPEDYLIENAMGNMGDALTNPKMILDVPVHKYAEADWFRMNINFERPDGEVVNSFANSGREVETRLEASALALYEITGGDDTSTTLLSGLINQHGWRDIVHLFAGPDGETIDFKPLPGGYDSATVEGPNGPVVTNRPGQIGDARLNVRRNEDGDYVIDVDWTMLANGPYDDGLNVMSPDNPQHRPYAGEEGTPINALGIRLQGSLVVSGEAAREGRLELMEGTGLQHHFTGKFAALS